MAANSLHRGTLIAILVVAFSCYAQKSEAQPETGPDPPHAEEAKIPEGKTGGGEPAVPERTRLNLLGEVDSGGGEARRNENVRLTLIDNNVLKEINQRMGTTANFVQDLHIDQNYFGTEFGGDPSPAVHVPGGRGNGTHAELNWSHSNSLLTARSFFQVGDVQPARTNDYGYTFTTGAIKKAILTLNGSQRKLRGKVNGNVLVPTLDERTPLTDDPERRSAVERLFGAFPRQGPNRTDINPHALNTNSTQNIDNSRTGAGLDLLPEGKDRFSLRYNYTLQTVEAFQLVGGQNPDTTTRNHQARATWSRIWSAYTVSDLTAGFDRIGSLLVPDETSLGIFYRFARTLESIGPGGNIPIDRAQNIFRYAAQLKQVRGRHAITSGVAVLRRQINGFESNEHRGIFNFRGDFGNDLITNLRLGLPSDYKLAIGDVHRGFRNWDLLFYTGDEWQVTPALSLSLGLRYQPVTQPVEVQHKSVVPYDCDCNNVAPRFGFAWRAKPHLVVRGAYGVHYGEIFAATFMQSRYNPPGNLTVNLTAPDFVHPLKDLKPSDLDPNARSSLFVLDRDLASPYSHQYSLRFELGLPRNWTLEMGYLGSRSHKLLMTWYENRARPVPGIPQTTATINDRRPDQSIYDVQHVLNGSIGYFDAGKTTLRLPRWRGFTIEASYWFSKAIDLGSDYTNTASGRDSRNSRSASEFDVQAQMKGLSMFDQTHAFHATVHYESPALSGANSWVRGALGSWRLSSILLLKSGTPFTVESGSDSPGFGNVDGASSDRPHLIDPSVLGRVIDHPDTSSVRLPASAFAFILPEESHGSLGRSTFRKDGVWNVNTALSRRWNAGGDRYLLFRAESLNFLNHAQFAEPGYELNAPDFGQITNTLNDGRSFRFTLTFGF